MLPACCSRLLDGVREMSVPMLIFLAEAQSISVHSFHAQNSLVEQRLLSCSLSYVDLHAVVTDHVADCLIFSAMTDNL